MSAARSNDGIDLCKDASTALGPGLPGLSVRTGDTVGVLPTYSTTSSAPQKNTGTHLHLRACASVATRMFSIKTQTGRIGHDPLDGLEDPGLDDPNPTRRLSFPS